MQSTTLFARMQFAVQSGHWRSSCADADLRSRARSVRQSKASARTSTAAEEHFKSIPSELRCRPRGPRASRGALSRPSDESLSERVRILELTTSELRGTPFEGGLELEALSVGKLV